MSDALRLVTAIFNIYMHSLHGIIAMNERAANAQPKTPGSKWAPRSAEDWDLGLTILEELIKLNGLHGQPMSRECIAEVVGVSKQAVENIENRAMQKVRRLTSHLRPELEDLGVVQRLSPFKTTAKVKGRKVRVEITEEEAENFRSAPPPLNGYARVYWGAKKGCPGFAV